MFRAIHLEKDAEGKTLAAIKDLDDADLPTFETGGVTVDVSHSTINYKDGLAITGKSPVVRKWPMVPGIDFAGVVAQSDHPAWKTGDRVVLNGYGVGEGHWGGLSQRARVSGDWLVRLPDGIDGAFAMALGTAGYTSMLCVMAFEQQGVKPGDGEILVTGATGGVGSFAVAMLAKLGHRVVGSTGKASEHAFLKDLGAVDVVDRATLSAAGKPLQKERWAGVVDTVGSHTLVNACAQTRYGGTVAACGLAQGMDLPGSVAPFILRGVKLVGVDSVMAPKALREAAWQRIAKDVPKDVIAKVATTVGLGDAIETGRRILTGEIRGRVVIDVNR